jgi:hypothetical protein
VFNSEFIRNTILVTERAGADSLIVRGPEGQDQIEQTEILHFTGDPGKGGWIDVDGPISSDAFRRADFADHRYEVGMVVSDIAHDNQSPSDQATSFSLLDDGTIMNTEVRDGTIFTADTTFDDAVGDNRGITLWLFTDDNNGRLRLNDFWDANNHIRLGDLDELSFDYFIAFSSRTDVTPVIRLWIDADGDLATTGDRGELVFEWAYQGFGDTTQDVWLRADLHGDDWNAWQRSFGVNRDFFPNIVPLSEWADADGFTPTGGLHFDEDSLIFGWSVALGSGNGVNDILLDNLAIGLTTYEFV